MSLTKLCKRANVRLQAAECSQLRRLLFSDDPNHQRGIATSSIVTKSAVQSHTLNVTLRRRNVVQSPFTVDDVDLCGRPPLLSNAQFFWRFSHVIAFAEMRRVVCQRQLSFLLLRLAYRSDLVTDFVV